MTAPAAQQFDPFVLGHDPFRVFARARAQGGLLPGVPPYPNLGPTVYLFSHHLVDHALKHARLVHSPPGEFQLIPEYQLGPGQHLINILNRSLLTADPPRLGVLRRPLSALLTPARVAGLNRPLQEAALALATRLARKGQFDAVQEFVIPFSVEVICTLLGIPCPEFALVRMSTDAMVRVLDFHLTEGAEEQAHALEAFITEIISTGRFEPDGMVAAMLAQEASGLWSRDEVIANILLLLFAGHETVTDAFGNALLELDATPSQRALLNGPNVGWSAAADELIRIGAPVHYAVRIAADDLNLNGSHLSRGTTVVAVLTSANRDTTVWPAGDSLRLDAPGSVAMTFGAGIHACIGRHLARVEIAALLQALFTAAPGWTLDRDSIVRRDSLLFRGLVSAPVHVNAV